MGFFTPRSLGLASTVLLAVNGASAWPNPPTFEGNITWIHDPAVVRRDDGTYFRFATDGGIAIATAPALTGPWEYQGAMLPNGSITHVDDDQHLWAPDCYHYNDLYYCFYAISTVGSQNSEIGVATSSNMEPGSWTDYGAIDLPENSDYNRIDPNLFVPGSDGPIYFTFGSYWHDIYQVELDPATNFTTRADGSEPWNIVYNGTISSTGNPPVVEGAFQWQWPNADGDMKYFLFFSSGACCQAEDELLPQGEEYKVMVCRADAPDGPFADQDGRDCLTEDGGTMILGSHDNIYAPGGQSVMIEAETDRVVLLYHYVNPEIGYGGDQFQFGFNYMDFSSGWPVVVE